MIVSIQLLRGIAAYLVALGHLSQVYPGTILGFQGAIGVDIFFIISGYIMAMTVNNADQSQTYAKEFYRRRIIRIWPVYIIACIGLVIWNKGLFGTTPQWAHFARSLTLIPFSDAQGALIYPYLGQAWTLTFEMIFYAWIAGLLFYKKLLICVFAGYFIKTKNAFLATLLASIQMEFLFGLWLFQLQQKLHRNVFNRLGQIMLLFAFPIFWYVKNGVASGAGGVYEGMTIILGDFKFQRWFLWGLPCVLIVWGFLGLENWFSARSYKKYLIMFGDGSYSLYLLHMTILLTINFFIKLTSSWHLFIVLTAFFVISTAFYKLIEYPVINYLKTKKLK
jgi:exopolysaccharide production protein ExoZ